MLSVKPGRGPSLMGGVGGIFFALVAGGMAVTAASFGAPLLFVLVPAGMAVFGLLGAIYSFWAATARHRPSSFDVTTGDEEPDPITTAMGYGPEQPEDDVTTEEHKPRRFEGEFCPFCGKKVDGEFDFCPHCGKDI